MPLPKLEQTLEKYEKHLQPLLDDVGKKRVHKIIEEFGKPGGIGQKLQLYLEEKQKKEDNWVG